MKKVSLLAIMAVFVTTVAQAQNCSTFTNITEGFPQFYVGEPVSFQIVFIGGAEPYKFEIIDGALPAGLHLTPSGRVVGVPQEPADVVVLIRASDAQGCVINMAFNTSVMVREPDPAP